MEEKLKLKKTLGLFDLFAISTGAMFSSGFFLLPGLAFAQAGPSVPLAYLFSGFLMVPAMLCIAELATALPRDGGSYYFIDRSLGSTVGNLAGFGVYLSLVLKTAITLVGLGAYAGLVLDIAIEKIAITMTLAFMLVNLLGAKQSSGLQKVLVACLIAVLVFFIVQGFYFISADMGMAGLKSSYTPFLPFGPMGLLSTVGFVFISYAGLTKIESVAEEIRNPERNIPLGMILALAVTVAIYTLGVFVVVAVLDHTAIMEDLTPIATAGRMFMDWLPMELGLLLVLAAAFAAFASTGNAGILAASRYPMGMARDGKIPSVFASLNRFRTPGASIVMTSVIVAASILALTPGGLVKMASTIHLVIMLLVNVSVIVMRNSGISYYDPGFRAPLFPYTQYCGIVVYSVLIIYMGLQPLLLSLGAFLLAYLWYRLYAGPHARTKGAVYHWFARLGKQRDPYLESEFVTLIREKGLRVEDSAETIVNGADVIMESRAHVRFEEMKTWVSGLFASELDMDPEETKAAFVEKTSISPELKRSGVVFMYAGLDGVGREPKLRILISPKGIERAGQGGRNKESGLVRVIFFLAGDSADEVWHMRLLIKLSGILEQPHAVERMLGSRDESQVKAYILDPGEHPHPRMSENREES